MAWSISCFFNACLSSLLFLDSFTLVRRASAWSDNILDLAFSAFFLWMNSMRTLLFLKHVALGLKVQLMVQVAINLLGLPVSLQEPSEDPHPGDPHSLLAGPSVLGTLPLSKATVTTLATGFIISADTGPGVDSDRLLDYKTILDQLPDVLPGVGVGDLVDLIGVEHRDD